MNDHGGRARLFLPAFLVLFAVLSFGSALQESADYDEPTHITAGYLYWKTGKYFLNPINTPLVRLWATLPLLAMPLHVPLPVPAWVIDRHLSLSDILFNFNPVPPDLILNAARSMILWLGVGLGYGVWRWSRELFGETAARASLIAYCFCPPLLAYSHLATADLGAAAFSYLAFYLFWRFQNQPSKGAAFRAGMGMGLNVTSKFTGVLLLPILGVIDGQRRVFQRRASGSQRASGGYLVAYVLGIVLVIVLVYRLVELPRIGQGLDDLKAVLTQETAQYFLGQYRTLTPWDGFYLVCLFLKSPIPFLIMVAAGLFLAAKNLYPNRSTALMWLLLPGVLYLLLLSFAHSQAGIRRLLFLYPLMCVWIGGATERVWKMSSRWRLGCCLLAAWYIVETLFLFPRYLSYFSPLVGGPANGYKYLGHTNLDCGQGLKALGRYLEKEGVEKIYLSYYGGGTPGAYGIRYIWVGPALRAYTMQHQEPEIDFSHEKKVLLAVSATPLVGAYFGGRHDFDWLRSRQPVAVFMDSLFVYDLTRDPDAHRYLAELLLAFGNTRQADLERRWRPRA